MIEVTDRSGLARAGKWMTEQTVIKFPNVIYSDTASFPAPPAADLRASWNEGLVISNSGFQLSKFCGDIHTPFDRKSEGEPVLDGDVAILDNSFELKRDARAFSDSIVSLRSKIGYNKLIFAPGLMEPSNLALLAYCGIDLFDNSRVLYETAKGFALLTSGTYKASDLGIAQEDLLERNMTEVLNELALVRHMISLGRLRELVETRVNASAWAVASLRLLDLEHYAFQERFTSVTGPNFCCNSKASLMRPDVRRFRERVMERWEPPKHKKILLMIPCSAKKPYYTSKSHRLFEEVLLSVPNSCAIQELIITSPLGTVPREFETFYPASQYDIPVTGNWDLEEIDMIQKLVRHAASFGFEKVICNLGSESEFVQEVVDCIDTSEGNSATSPEALSRLREVLMEECQKVEKVPRALDRIEMVRSMCKYQFGKEGSALLDNASVVGKYPYLKIMRDGVQLGMLTPERGMISLTLEGAEVLSQLNLNVIEIGDFDLTGSLFSVGIVSADERIRPGDEVVIRRNGELAGAGVSLMSGSEMADSRRGEAVKVRHKIKKKQ